MDQAIAEIYYIQERREMALYIPLGATRILDVGCGAGVFGHYVKQQKDIEVWGIELNGEAAAEAATKLDVVITGDAVCELQHVPIAGFDCVFFNDVLEHLPAPEDVLKSARRALKPGGLCIVSVPNLRNWGALKHILWEADFRYTDAGIFDRTHIRWFTVKSLTRLFGEAGYQISYVGGIGSSIPTRKVLQMAFRLCICLFPRFRDVQYFQLVCVATSITDDA